MTSYIDTYETNSGATIKIDPVRSQIGGVTFKAFITSFSDNITSNWNEEQVYGRQDPIGTFQSTTRKISLGFDVPAATIAEAKSELGSDQPSVKQFMYPSYSSNTNHNTTTNALSLAKSPLVSIKVCKLNTEWLRRRWSLRLDWLIQRNTSYRHGNVQ
jgi:hypothetical protein